MRTRTVTMMACAAAVLMAGCGGPGTPDEPAELTVSAAASLTGVFGQLEKQFERANPGVDVRINYGGSPALAQQIAGGAPVDVFAAANTATMDTVAKAGLVAGQPSVFVTNKLQIAVAPGNPKHIAGFADLARPELKVVVCAPKVPCGSAEKTVEQLAGVAPKPVSEESDVTSVLSKVSSGDADAGVVYLTDVKSAEDKVDGVSFPEAERAINTYPIAVLKGSAQPELAARWVALMKGPDGQRVLQAAGFGTP